MTIIFRNAIILMAMYSLPVHAITCYFTAVKDNCWKNYDVTIEMFDADTGKGITSITVFQDQEKSWGRQEFECHPGQTLSMAAKFSPSFWAGDDNKVFQGQRYWKLPDEIKKGEVGWNVTICFPMYFANVPVPPEATAGCFCDIASIPKAGPEVVDKK